jgi:hypothetical protein
VDPGKPLSTAVTACRFGITSPLGREGYDIASLGVGSYLDWEAVGNPSLPEGREYIHVLRVRDDLFEQTLANLPAWVDSHPGSVWVIGNEPDTTYSGQDALLAEVYAERYLQLARMIRKRDHNALLAFGSVVQPTPIRIRYLTRAWQKLVDLTGGVQSASRLIDIWSIHSFILNEEYASWGTGLPPGFEHDHGDAFIIPIDQLEWTYSIDIFQSRIQAFRVWMASIGERDKPLWITEYGSLFPPIDPPGGPDYYNVSDADTKAFMLATFDYMLDAADNRWGMPSDGNQLVQRWYWYSLNDYRYQFGGTLFDPDNGKEPTAVGQDFIAYQSAHLASTDLYPQSLTAYAMSYDPTRTHVNYRLDIHLGNNQYTDASCARVWVYDGDPNNGGALIAGPIPASQIRRSGEIGTLSVTWTDVEPLTCHTLYVRVDAIGVDDVAPLNNLGNFYTCLGIPIAGFLPFIQR